MNRPSAFCGSIGPLKIDNPGSPDAFIIDEIQRRRKINDQQDGRIPLHRDGPEDWSQYPEPQDEGTLNPTRNPDTNPRGIVDIDHNIDDNNANINFTLSDLGKRARNGALLN
jgi:hypothetical protein